MPTTTDNTLCAVCGEKIEDASVAPQMTFLGRTYYFRCEGCKARFAADPGRYSAVVDGDA